MVDILGEIILNNRHIPVATACDGELKNVSCNQQLFSLELSGELGTCITCVCVCVCVCVRVFVITTSSTHC